MGMPAASSVPFWTHSRVTIRAMAIGATAQHALRTRVCAPNGQPLSPHHRRWPPRAARSAPHASGPDLSSLTPPQPHSEPQGARFSASPAQLPCGGTFAASANLYQIVFGEIMCWFL